MWQFSLLLVMWSVKTRHMSQKEINIIILMFFFIFYGLWTSVTFDTSFRGDTIKKFRKENNSNFHMTSITQNINFAPCDKFSQIPSDLVNSRVQFTLQEVYGNFGQILQVMFVFDDPIHEKKKKFFGSFTHFMWALCIFQLYPGC